MRDLCRQCLLFMLVVLGRSAEGKNEQVDFSCAPEQLQAVAASLRDAVKALSRVNTEYK